MTRDDLRAEDRADAAWERSQARRDQAEEDAILALVRCDDCGADVLPSDDGCPVCMAAAPGPTADRWEDEE